jgi:hypothetical protein
MELSRQELGGFIECVCIQRCPLCLHPKMSILRRLSISGICAVIKPWASSHLNI